MRKGFQKGNGGSQGKGEKRVGKTRGLRKKGEGCLLRAFLTEVALIKAGGRDTKLRGNEKRKRKAPHT